MWALKKPNGKLLEWTASDDKDGAQCSSVIWLARNEPKVGHVEPWHTSIEVLSRARRLGYRVVRCKLVEVTK